MALLTYLAYTCVPAAGMLLFLAAVSGEYRRLVTFVEGQEDQLRRERMEADKVAAAHRRREEQEARLGQIVRTFTPPVESEAAKG